jgi:transcriptional regulator with XRE-family HTH domain
MKTLAQRMAEIGMSSDQLVTASGLDKRLIKAVVSGNFTPSPAQRQRLAAALGVSIDEVSWDHAVSVQHLRGNGPQCGRPT